MTMNSKLHVAQQLLLLVSGALAILIAGLILLAPIEFYATNGIQVAGNPSLLSELKAPAGPLLVAGVFMLAAINRRELFAIAVLLAAAIYLSYAGARLISMALDGLPSAGLLHAAIVEMALGLACVTVLWLRRDHSRGR